MKHRKKFFNKAFSLLGIMVLVAATLLPLALPKGAGAAQLTSRSLQINSGVPSKTGVQYKFTFTVAATSTVQSLKIQFCNTAVGTCSGTAGTDVPNATSAAWVSQNNWQGGTNFAAGAGTGDCTASSTVICANRTDATNQTATSRDITFGTITNPSTANITFFARITTYSDASYTLGNIQDTGTTASAVVQSLTVNAAVAEILNFCVGSTTVNDATTSVGADCSAVTGTSLNLGTLDTSSINTSPINTNGGDNKNGVAMLRTNAASGATVSYDAIQAGSGTNHLGTLRITGANCNAGNVNTDACIDAQGGTQGTFTAGTEKFGMTIGGTNCGSTTAYTCNYTTPTNHLAPSSNYIGNSGNTYGTGNGFAWVEGGTVTQIASSSQPVDDEALILRFAATPSITTPFGAYSVSSDYIAVTTY